MKAGSSVTSRRLCKRFALILLFDPPVDPLQQVGANLVQQHGGAVMDPLGEDEPRFPFLGLAPCQKEGFDRAFLLPFLGRELSWPVGELFLDYRDPTGNEATETFAKIV